VVFKGVVEQLFGEGSCRPHNNASPFREAMEQLKMGPAYTMRWFDLVVQIRNNRTVLYTRSDHKKRNASNSSSADIRYEDYSDPRMTFMFNGGSLPHLNKKGAALTGFPWDSSDLYHRDRGGILSAMLACGGVLRHRPAQPLYRYDDDNNDGSDHDDYDQDIYGESSGKSKVT
jgi:hypothetical protein